MNNKNNSVVSDVVYADRDSTKWTGLNTPTANCQSINDESFHMPEKTGVVVGYCVEGETTVLYKLSDGGWHQRQLVKDDFMVVMANEVSAWDIIRVNGCSSPVMFLSIDQALIDMVISEAASTALKLVELKRMVNQRDPVVIHIFKRLLVEIKKQGSLNRFVVDSLKKKLITHLLRIHVTSSYEVTSNSSSTLSKYQLNVVNSYMESYYGDQIKLKDLAGQLNLSEFYFARLYKKTTQISPYQYLLSCRLRIAQELLVTTRLTIQQISYQVGYKNAGAFSKAFIKFFHVSPRTYRKNSFS